MAGPLGVTHLLLFSRSEAGNTNLRLAKIPRGPTLHFRVDKYSLAKDIFKSMKHPRTGATSDFDMAPLLVMNNFITSDAEREKLGDKAPPKHLEKLVTDMFQGLFPPIQPHTTPLHAIKRVLLLNREPPSEENGSCTISLRHYAITTKIAGLSKPIRRLYAAEKLIGSREKKKRGLPNLGALDDVADYMLDPSAAGYTSASDTELDTDAEVEVAATVTRKVMSKRDRERAKAATGDEDARKPHAARPKVEKRAVKLVELGPRLKLRLTKVEEDICGGKVMWHEYVTKSEAEVKQMDQVWEKRNAEKAERRRIQRENIERKRKERGGASAAKGKGEDGEGEEEDEDEDMEDYDEYDMDDDVWHDEDGGEEGEEEMEDAE